MIFNTGYYHPMDREYEAFGMGISEIGTSTHPAKDALEGLKAAIFQGSSRVELGFTGVGKGNRGQGAPTPGSYGKDEREAMKQLARINKVKLSTHSSVGVSGFAGLGRQNAFEDALRENNIREVERAIDFAADVTEGGPVVVHTGEFQRSISGEFEGEGFEAFPGEKEKTFHYLIDPKSGRMIDAVTEDEEIWMPEPEKFEDGPYKGEDKFVLNPDGSYKLDENGKQIPVWKTDSQGNIRLKPVSFHQFAEPFRKKGVDDEEIAKQFFNIRQEAEVDHHLGQAREYEMQYNRGLKERDSIIERHNFFQKLKIALENDYGVDTPKFREEWEKVSLMHKEETRGEDPLKHFNELLNLNERQISYGREIALSSRRQAERLKATIVRTEGIKEYGLKKTADSLARLAEYAYDVKKQKGVKEDLFIAPENIYPETYGGHPDELKDIILESRKRFEEIWVQKHGEDSRDEAKENAKNLIKGTFDIGHAHIWKKYFQGSDKDFYKWMDKKVDELIKADVIGHVHVSDNFGYEDEHLTPGQGGVGAERFRNFVERFKKAGVKEVIVEAGGQPGGAGWLAMMGGWSAFGSPIYGAERGRWTDVSGSYFGKTNPPPYIFGDYSPSQEYRGAPFWSGLGLE